MNKRILVVDDEPDILRALQSHLEGWGYTVETAIDGDAALKALSQGTYDGMTLGIMMPKINGLEVLRRLRQTNQSLPVVIISAGFHYLQESDRQFMSNNTQELLLKPFEAEKFKQVVERWFGLPS